MEAYLRVESVGVIRGQGGLSNDKEGRSLRFETNELSLRFGKLLLMLVSEGCISEVYLAIVSDRCPEGLFFVIVSEDSFC